MSVRRYISLCGNVMIISFVFRFLLCLSVALSRWEVAGTYNGRPSSEPSSPSVYSVRPSPLPKSSQVSTLSLCFSSQQWIQLGGTRIHSNQFRRRRVIQGTIARFSRIMECLILPIRVLSKTPRRDSRWHLRRRIIPGLRHPMLLHITDNRDNQAQGDR